MYIAKSITKLSIFNNNIRVSVKARKIITQQVVNVVREGSTTEAEIWKQR